MIIVILGIIVIAVYMNHLMFIDKRFQESNKVEQMLRYRFYLYIPFLWVWNMIKGFRVYRDEIIDGKLVHTNNYNIYRGRELWKLLIGIQQGSMKWYYTSEEVFDNIRKKYPKGD